MKKVQGLVVSRMLFAALGTSLIVAAIVQAQADLPTFRGKFTLATQVRWDTVVLQPGEYTITIESGSMPIFALVSDSKGRPVGRLVSTVDAGKTSVVNALLIREKGGQLRVYSLELASLGRILIYDPVLAREAVMEARAPQTVPVTLSTVSPSNCVHSTSKRREQSVLCSGVCENTDGVRNRQMIRPNGTRTPTIFMGDIKPSSANAVLQPCPR
jgi:hypothetical protein